MTYRAIPCACGDSICKDWHVSNVAEVQGVKFNKIQAEAVAALLNLGDAQAEQTIELAKRGMTQ